MSAWSAKRRFAYGGIFLVLAFLVVGGIFYKLLYRAPTCTDGVQNGDETGIDCGGSCKTLCPSQSLKPVVLWSNIFHVSGDLYTAVAYVENPNLDSENPQADYELKVYDAKGAIIAIRNGQTSIPANQKFAIFETGIALKSTVPASADVTFTSLGPWQKDTMPVPQISVSHGDILDATSTPTIFGTVENPSLSIIGNIELDAFISDANGNVIAASRTFINNLSAHGSQDFVFTWPEPFTATSSLVTIVSRVE